MDWRILVFYPQSEAFTAWDPPNQKKIKSIEQVQKRAARFVHNNYTDRTPGCVTNMVKSELPES